MKGCANRDDGMGGCATCNSKLKIAQEDGDFSQQNNHRNNPKPPLQPLATPPPSLRAAQAAWQPSSDGENSGCYSTSLGRHGLRPRDDWVKDYADHDDKLMTW